MEILYKYTVGLVYFVTSFLALEIAHIDWGLVEVLLTILGGIAGFILHEVRILRRETHQRISKLEERVQENVEQDAAQQANIDILMNEIFG